MTQLMSSDDFLAHYGVKGMKWGVRRTRSERQAQRQENRVARNKTREAVRRVNAKPEGKTDQDIIDARKKLPASQRKLDRARDQYKVDKHIMNRIDAKRPTKVAAAELMRISRTADKLTKNEQFDYDMMQAGRAISDAFFRDTPRSDFQKLVDRERDKNRVRGTYN